MDLILQIGPIARALSEADPSLRPAAAESRLDTPGIKRAGKTLENINGAWINEMKVKVEDGKISAYRVNMKVTFTLKD